MTHKKKILIVADEDVGKSLSENFTMRSDSWDVDYTSSFSDAISQIGTVSFDMLILDVPLGLNQNDKRVAELFAETSNLRSERVGPALKDFTIDLLKTFNKQAPKIVYFTTCPPNHLSPQELEGVDLLIKKPMRQPELVQIIQNMLDTTHPEPL